MIYHIFEKLFTLAFKVFFRKIYSKGMDKIPKEKRILYAVNHPTAFIEPILIGCIVPKNVHVLLRGDVFKPGFAEWYLRKIKTIPIFRRQDGLELMKRNAASLDEITQILHEGSEAVLVLSEGVSKHEKRLRPIQKGTARMAFGLFDEHGHTDLAIVPVSINYADATKFRTILTFEVGTPLLLEDYLPLYKEHNKKAINKLTKDIGIELRKNVVHVEDEKDDDLVDLVLEFNRNDYHFKAFPYMEENNELLRQEVDTVEKINVKDAEEKDILKKKVDAYLRRLHEYRTSDFGVAQPDKSNFFNWILLIIGFPFHLIGLIWNFPPIRLAKRMADNNSKEIKFYSSLAFGAGFFAWIGWYLIWIIASLFLCNWVGALATIILMPVLGRIALLYAELRQEVAEARSYLSLPQAEKDALITLRSEVLSYVK